MSEPAAVIGGSPIGGEDPGRPSGAIWLARAVLAAAILVTVLLLALAIGLRLDDAQIDAHPGSATATVLAVTALRTGIEFVTGAGQTVRPPGGVLYPGLLHVGEQFVVQYDTANPDIVRVAGRTAAVGNLTIALTAAVTWAIAAPLVAWLRRRSGRTLLPWRRLIPPAEPGRGPTPIAADRGLPADSVPAGH